LSPVPRHLQQASRDAATAVRAVRPQDPLASTLDTLIQAPLTVWVVGRQGVGKTQLINQATGTLRPTGLGGITQHPHVVVHAGVRWVDTPAIEAHATRPTEPPDVVVWLIDGLQPLAQLAREHVATLVGEHTTLRPLIGRADLVSPEDQPAITERVQRLLAPHVAEAPRWFNGRLPLDIALLDALTAPPSHLAPHRAASLRRAFTDARDHLGPAPLDLHTAPAALRDGWRRTVASVTDALPTLAQDQPLAATFEALPAHASRAVLAFRTSLRDEPVTAQLVQRWGQPPLPKLVVPRPPNVLRVSLSGHAGAQRALRGALADWMMEGELLLVEWLGTGLPDRRGDDQLRTALSALDTAEALL
jgi:hypothetical protein